MTSLKPPVLPWDAYLSGNRNKEKVDRLVNNVSIDKLAIRAKNLLLIFLILFSPINSAGTLPFIQLGAVSDISFTLWPGDIAGCGPAKGVSRILCKRSFG